VIIGLYAPGESLFHRLSAGIKIGSLFVLGTLLVLMPYWWTQVFALNIVLVLWYFSQLGFKRLTQIGWVVPMFVLMTILLNGYFSHWEHGFVMGVRLVALVIFSMLVTYTTTLDEMSEFITRIMTPIKYIGGNPAIVGFAVSFCLRFIPVITSAMADIREAQIARGQTATAATLVAPLIIRLLRISTEIAESLDARGFDGRT
jgi:biotin transport system permease protein